MLLLNEALKASLEKTKNWVYILFIKPFVRNCVLSIQRKPILRHYIFKDRNYFYIKKQFHSERLKKLRHKSLGN